MKHFFDYRTFSKSPCFDLAIPYTQVKHIVLEQNSMIVKYRLSFESQTMLEHRSLKLKVTRQTVGSFDFTWTNLTLQETPPKLSKEKRKDLKSLYKFMTPVNRQFYKTILDS